MKKMFLVSLSLVLALTGCGAKKEKTNKENATKGKYESPIVMTSAITSDSLKFVDGEDLENNIWTRALYDEAGIELKFLWSCPDSQWDQKWNVAIASGDIPDVMSVREKHYKILYDNDMIQPLDGLVDEYGSDQLKELISLDVNDLSRYSMRDGKQMSIPRYGIVPDDAPILYIRQDWLDNLGLSVPQTMSELCDIAVAFTEKDPDGNGKNDTYGIAAGKVIDKTSGIASLCGFFNGYGAYLKIWIDGEDGLEYSSIRPEVKTALKALQDLYAKGAIDKEFAVKDGTKAFEDVAAGKAGIYFGDYWAAGNLKNSVMNDESAKWTIAEVPGIGTQPSVMQATGKPSSYITVSKKYDYPEALVKYLNVVVDKLNGPDAQKYHTENGIGFFKYLPILIERPWKNLNAHLNIMEALKTNDTSNMNYEELMYWDRIKQYKDGDITMYGTNAIFGENGAYSIVNKYKNEERIKTDAYLGMSTDTKVSKGSTLDKLEDETFTNIIMGEDISEFDKFIDSWYKLGGTDLTKEYNEEQAIAKK